MEGTDSGASVYTEAKSEYTKQLTLYLVPAFHRFFMELLQQAVTEEPQVKRQLWKFQESLSQIPDWNMDKVHRETNRIINGIQCDYMEELLTAVFIAHTKVLTAIRIGNKNKRVNIVVPKLDHFFHRALSESSRLLWSSAYLFHSELPPMEKQKNHRQIEQLLHDGVAQAIRGMLPVKNILKDYLSEPEPGHDHDDEADDEDDEKEPKEQTGGSTPAPAPEPEPVPEPVQEIVPEPIPVPAPEPVPEPVQELIPDVIPEPISAPVQAPEPIPAPLVTQPSTEPSTPIVPTLVIDTEPTVRFTDFNQMIREDKHGTEFSYVAHSNEANGEGDDDEDDERMPFLDEDGEPLSDFEDLDAAAAESLSDGDFETL
jgi:hypothetical protein